MPDPERPDPDALLAAVQKEAEARQRGTLKVFLGMAAGVGKTYAMLKAAQQQRAAGRDVVIGYVESHGRKETDALAEGLEVVPRKPIVHRGMTLTELDLDAVLARRPRLVLVDELAHTNAPGSRHPKRYQDVAEVLDAGIDVYTTLNVQHVESRCGTVREITGAVIHETVPDSVLDDAGIELVDLSPDVLLRRLDEGKVYLPERAGAALSNFFRAGNLTALREIALRFAAERVGQDVRDYMQAQQITGPWKTGHRLLVAVSPSPFSEQMVRWTRRLADSLECSWIAAYVDRSRPLSEGEQTRLTRHFSLAKELGAEVRTTSDDDIVRGLLRIARAQNVTQIVVGKPALRRGLSFFGDRSLLARLVHESGNIDVHVVRVDAEGSRKRPPPWRMRPESGWPQYAAALGAVAAVTALNLLLAPLVGARSVALIFLMVIVGLAMWVGRGPVYLAAALSAILWNYLFLPPKYTFYVQSLEDAMMLGMYFIVAIAMGQLISRVRARERTDRRREERATAMYLLTLDLADASTREQIERVVADNVQRVFAAGAALLLPDAEGKLSCALADKERGAAQWAYDHAKPAGRFTDTLPMAEGMYVPLSTSAGMLGVLAMTWKQTGPPTLDQASLLEAFQRHIALVLDRQRLRDAETQARLVAESERLGKALLNSISHEFRTPIAAIDSAAGAVQQEQDPKVRRELLREIQSASGRLNRLVGNILDMTRLESGHVKPRIEMHEVGDLIQAALQRVEGEMAQHPVDVLAPPDLPPLRADFGLMEHALVNLLLNAATHTPAGTSVQIRAEAQDGELSLAVADRGAGLPHDAVHRIFDKFYRAPGSAAGGTGLGLSIVKGFVEAQGGRVDGANRAGGGAVFTITMPLGREPER
jgi:two-component system, OmpR family, sensor histidine kinase KdpD